MAFPLFVTVFFNGMGSTRVQGLRYANEIVTVDADGNELYRAAREAHDRLDKPLLHNVLPAEDFNDVAVLYHGGGEPIANETPRASSWRWWTWATALVEVPGRLNYVLRVTKWFPPCSRQHIEKGLDDVRRAIAQHPNTPIVIYGASRGAGLCLMVLEELTKQERSRIHLVIAEAPFDTIANVIADRLSLPDPLRYTLQWFVALVHRGPLDADIPHDVPIVIGSGTEDRACPVHGQHRLAHKLRDHPNVDHVVIEGANHHNIFQAPSFVSTVRKRMP